MKCSIGVGSSSEDSKFLTNYCVLTSYLLYENGTVHCENNKKHCSHGDRLSQLFIRYLWHVYLCSRHWEYMVIQTARFLLSWKFWVFCLTSWLILQEASLGPSKAGANWLLSLHLGFISVVGFNLFSCCGANARFTRSPAKALGDQRQPPPDAGKHREYLTSWDSSWLGLFVSIPSFNVFGNLGLSPALSHVYTALQTMERIAMAMFDFH